MTAPLPPLPEPRRRAVFATSKNTDSVRKGFEMGGYEKEPPMFDELQMEDYAKLAVREALERAVERIRHPDEDGYPPMGSAKAALAIRAMLDEYK